MTTIKIATIHGDRDVDAHVYGDWAAHKGHGRRGWVVTHVPSGRCLPDLGIDLGKRESCAIANALYEEIDSVEYRDLSRDPDAEATLEMLRDGIRIRDVAWKALTKALRSIDG